MRTLLGAVGLVVGVFIATGSTFVAIEYRGAERWVLGAVAGVGSGLTGTSCVLLFARPKKSSRRLLVVLLAVAGGQAGFVLGASHLFKYCGIEARGQGYKLTVRVFEKTLDEETGPAVQRERTTGPSAELEGKMACSEIGLDTAFVGVGAVLGGLLGVVIRQLTPSRSRGMG